jgi:large subunit ribosomal protein L23
MAIFTKDTKKKAVAKKATPKKEKKAVTVMASSAKALTNTKLESIIKAPWLSEKALIGTERSVYVFAVPTEATKPLIKAAIERIYKVVPVKVNIVHLPGKSKTLRTKRGYGRRAARHKAYVYLKKGETITFA